LNEKFQVIQVVTQPDKPLGRKQILTAPPVKRLALELGIPVEQPAKLRNNQNFIDKLKSLSPDIVVVAAYGKILPKEILNLPEHGCVNVHASLLPKYRGASPIQSAILNGDQETGITIMLMDFEMDTGDIISQKNVRIAADDTYRTLSDKLVKVGSALLLECLMPYVKGEINLQIQNTKLATYCAKITTAMGKINWQETASQIANKIRAFGEDVVCFTDYNGQRLLITKAQVHNLIEENAATPVGTVSKCPYDKDCVIVKCGSGALKLIEVQLAGKKPLMIKDFLNGHKDFIDSVLK
jgi:methionyl-tRNA formyltransferase